MGDWEQGSLRKIALIRTSCGKTIQPTEHSSEILSEETYANPFILKISANDTMLIYTNEEFYIGEVEFYENGVENPYDEKLTCAPHGKGSYTSAGDVSSGTFHHGGISHVTDSSSS